MAKSVEREETNRLGYQNKVANEVERAHTGSSVQATWQQTLEGLRKLQDACTSTLADGGHGSSHCKAAETAKHWRTGVEAL